MTNGVTILPPRKKLKIKLPDWRPPKEKPPRLCRCCDDPAVPEWDFDTHGHPDVCGKCRHPRGRLAFSTGASWEDLIGGTADIRLMNQVGAVIKQIERTARG